MKTEIEYDLKHHHFIILGLVAEDPDGEHAYNINKKIEERGMRNWTNIGIEFSLSTIYRVLDRLEEDRLLESEINEVENRKRKVYTLTDFGYKILKSTVYNILNDYHGKRNEEYYVAFSMFPILSKEEQLEAFRNSLSNMKNNKRELEKMLNENLKLPINVTGLFKHPIMILQTNIKFLDQVIKIIEEKKHFGTNF